METKEKILTAIISKYYDDLEFIEKINDLTYARKVQLKGQQYKTKLSKYENK